MPALFPPLELSQASRRLLHNFDRPQNPFPGEVSASSIQHPAFSTRHSAFSIRHSAFSIQHSAFSIQHSAFSTTRLFPFIIRVVSTTRLSSLSSFNTHISPDVSWSMLVFGHAIRKQFSATCPSFGKLDS